MSAIKQSTGTRVRDVGVLDETAQRRLEALSVTTAEELFGLIAADPEGTAKFLGDVDLSVLQADLALAVGPQAMSTLEEVGTQRFALGAAPPTDAGPLPEQADPEVFEREVFPAGAAGGPDEDAPRVDLRSCMNDVRNQFDRGTCVAHAVAALAECLMRGSGKQVDLSEQHLYWQAKDRDGAPQQAGTYIRIALDCMVDTGACLEETWPYQRIPVPGNEGQSPPPQAAGEEAGSYRLSRATQVKERDSDAVRQVLDGGRPVALSVPVYQNWYGNPATNAYGFIPMPLPTTKLEGGHAMCAVGYGYDTDFAGGGYFILRNSWGSTWASRSPIASGHALLPFRYQDVYGWETISADA